MTSHGSLFSEFSLKKSEFLGFLQIANACTLRRVSYNDFIQGFGQEFDTFDIAELSQFLKALRSPGLN